jgi:hypothetical protein
MMKLKQLELFLFGHIMSKKLMRKLSLLQKSRSNGFCGWLIFQQVGGHSENWQSIDYVASCRDDSIHLDRRKVNDEKSLLSEFLLHKGENSRLTPLTVNTV